MQITEQQLRQILEHLGIIKEGEPIPVALIKQAEKKQ